MTVREWLESEQGRRVMSDAMQRFQDHTYLDENSHRYHCGGSEYPRLLAHILSILDESEEASE